MPFLGGHFVCCFKLLTPFYIIAGQIRHCKMKNFSCGHTLKRKYFLVYLKQI